LGIEEIISIDPVDKLTPVPDKFGNYLPVFLISVVVPYKPVKARQPGLKIRWRLIEKKFYVNESDFNSELNYLIKKERELTRKFGFINEPAKNHYKISFFVWNGKDRYLQFNPISEKEEKDNNSSGKHSSAMISLSVEKGKKMREVLWLFFRKYFNFSYYYWELSDLEINSSNGQGSFIKTYILGVHGDFEFKGKPFGEWKNIPFEIEPFYDDGLRFKISNENPALKLLEYLGYRANFIVDRAVVSNTAK